MCAINLWSHTIYLTYLGISWKRSGLNQLGPTPRLLVFRAWPEQWCNFCRFSLTIKKVQKTGTWVVSARVVEHSEPLSNKWFGFVGVFAKQPRRAADNVQSFCICSGTTKNESGSSLFCVTEPVVCITSSGTDSQKSVFTGTCGGRRNGTEWDLFEGEWDIHRWSDSRYYVVTIEVTVSNTIVGCPRAGWHRFRFYHWLCGCESLWNHWL